MKDRLLKQETVALWHAVRWFDNVLREWRKDESDCANDPKYVHQKWLLENAKMALRKVNRLREDSLRLDTLCSESGLNLVNDDRGKWAVSDSGMQPVAPKDGFTEMVSIMCFVEPEDWKPTIREAIDGFRAKRKP